MNRQAVKQKNTDDFDQMRREIKPTDTFAKLDLGTGKEQLVQNMNSLLANEFSIFTKTLKYHWNVTGPRFHSMHEFLDEQYNELLTIIDDVAERIREIDGVPIGTLHEMTSQSVIPENPGTNPETTRMIENLVSGHEVIASQIRDMLRRFDGKFNDPGSEDFLTGLLQKHEQMAWMLKSHIRH